MDLTETTTIDRLQIGLLLDTYGPLLSARAFEVLERYYNDDLSLTEIAELLQISRQAVHDRLQQGVVSLRQYEEKLCLLARFHQQKETLRAIITDLDEGQVTSARDRLNCLEHML